MTRVRCLRCRRGTYDLGDVEVVARYADATVFKAPCCGALVDDRTWKSSPDFDRLTERERAERFYQQTLGTSEP